MNLEYVDEEFLESRPMVVCVLGYDAVFSEGFSASWDDLFHCWCGMPL